VGAICYTVLTLPNQPHFLPYLGAYFFSLVFWSEKRARKSISENNCSGFLNNESAVGIELFPAEWEQHKYEEIIDVFEMCSDKNKIIKTSFLKLGPTRS